MNPLCYPKAQKRIKEVIGVLENALGHKMERVHEVFEGSHWDMYCAHCGYCYRVVIDSEGQGEAWIKLMENGRAVEKVCWSEWSGFNGRPRRMPMQGNCKEMAIREIV